MDPTPVPYLFPVQEPADRVPEPHPPAASCIMWRITRVGTGPLVTTLSLRQAPLQPVDWSHTTYESQFPNFRWSQVAK